MVDLIGIADPLKVLRLLQIKPDVIILHKGRDEEKTKGKVIQYHQVTRIKSKYDVCIAAAGGIDLREARSAIFNGVNIIIVNMQDASDNWQGISFEDDIGEVAEKFLQTIE